MSYGIGIKYLLKWFRKNKRDLPWRHTKDPYHIWISEVMLQQTQVATVIPYYERFLETFPTLTSLAEAEDDLLFKQWEGLGYYHRAKNLRAAAKDVVSRYNGMLPRTKNELLELKGFGEYTSGSVASIAFGESCSAIDGNVIRVISRIYGISSTIEERATRQEIESIVNSLLPKSDPGEFNEALMEFGALVCTPRTPNCIGCPLRDGCNAFHTARVMNLPVKRKKEPVPHHHIAVGVIFREGHVLIAKRADKGLLPNLWEFPGGKREKGETLEETCRREIKEETGLSVEVFGKITSLKHAYSHFKITLHAFHCYSSKGTARAKSSQEVRWVPLSELSHYPFPKANEKLLSLITTFAGGTK